MTSAPLLPLWSLEFLSLAHQVRTCDQHEDRESARYQDSQLHSAARRQGDRMITRRSIVIALGATAFAVPLASFAQQPAGKIPRLGYLSAATAENDKNRMSAFRQGLQALGYLEGNNIVIEERYAALQFEKLPDLAAELVRIKSDVLVVYGDLAVHAARKTSTTIPIVFTVVPDPVAEGFVASLARPGGQVTGQSDLHSVLVTKRLELLKEVVPSASRIGVLFNAKGAAQLRQLQDIQAAAPAYGVAVLSLPVTASDDIDRAFAAMKKEHSWGLIVLGDPVIGTHRRQIVDLAAKARLPAIFTVRESVDAGGLMSYGANFPELWRRTATYVDKILRALSPAIFPSSSRRNSSWWST